MRFNLPPGLEKIRKTSIDVTNFVLLLPVYIIGVGIGAALWRIETALRKPKCDGWKESNGYDEDYHKSPM